MKDRQLLWLAGGIGSIASVVGYMVGGSYTPVVSVAVPAVFGLVITALGFIGGSSVGKKIDELKALLPPAKEAASAGGGAEKADAERLTQVEGALASIKEELSVSPARVGKLLIVFTSFYVLGLGFGTYARVTNLYAPSVTRQLPWANVTGLRRPPTPAEAVDWIALQEQLLQLGYTREQIAEIYSIQVEEWNKPPAAAPDRPAAPAPTNQTAGATGATGKDVSGEGGGNLSGRLKEGGKLPDIMPGVITAVGHTQTLPHREKPSDPMPSPTLDSSKLP